MRKILLIVICFLFVLNTFSQRLTNGEVFNFNIGDQFNYVERFRNVYSSHDFHLSNFEIVDKFILNDSLCYVRDKKERTGKFEYLKDTLYYNDYRASTDTVCYGDLSDTISIFGNYLKSYSDSWKSYMVEENWMNFGGETNYFVDSIFENCFFNIDSFYISCVLLGWTEERELKYGKGLGCVFAKVPTGLEFNACCTVNELSLVYYKSASDDCGSVQNIPNKVNELDTSNDYTYINSDESIIFSKEFRCIKLYNLTGQLIDSVFNQNELLFSNNIRNGIYFVYLEDQNTKKTIKIYLK